MPFETVIASDVHIPDACTLPTVDQPLRLAEFDQLFDDVVLDATVVEPGRALLSLRSGAAVAARTAELVARETECCSFFTFTLTVSGSTSSLEVRAPAQYANVVEALAQRAARPAQDTAS